MSSIDSRLSKLERHVRDAAPQLTKQERDDHVAAVERQAKAVAAVCDTWQDVAAFLKSLMPAEDRETNSLERRRQIDAFANGNARRIFHEVHLK